VIRLWSHDGTTKERGGVIQLRGQFGEASASESPAAQKIPNHSVLSKARARWGKEVFESLFVRTVAQCVEAGLVDAEGERGQKGERGQSLLLTLWATGGNDWQSCRDRCAFNTLGRVIM